MSVVTAALLLADHEGLYEFSRMSRAVAVGVVLAGLSAYIYRKVRPPNRHPWENTAGRFALAALGVAVLTIAFGLIPRETASGYIICGPPLNLPDAIPAFSDAGVGWADSQSCNGLMAWPMRWLVIGLSSSAALFAAARVAASRSRSASADEPHAASSSAGP